MNTSALPEPPPPLSESQRAALVSLLSDEDPTVYQAVRQRILVCGSPACLWLRPHTLSSDPVVRRRVLEIVHVLARQDSDNRFLGFCLSQGEECDAERGAWLLAQTQYPEINTAAYEALLDSYAAELREHLNPNPGAEATLATINQHLYGELGFSGNEQNYYDPDNSYLNRVIDRRMGNPISLCLVYYFLARRLQLPVVGIGMPGHFLCRYQTPTEELYIDAFNQGRLLTKADCVKYLHQTNYGFHESHLAPVSARRALLRMCTNLHQIYHHLELNEERERFQRYIVALAK